MKKSLSILLLWIFLFNVGGYYFFIGGLLYSAHKDLSRKISRENISPGELYEFKVSLTLPYPVHQKEYRRVDGQFERHGEFYTLVKQKLENDTLYILCVKDHSQKRLSEVLTEFANVSNDVTGSSERPAGHNLLNRLIKEYCSHGIPAISNNNTGWCRPLCRTLYASSSSEPEGDIFSPPPNLFC